MSVFRIIQINCQGGLWVLMNVYEVAQSKCQINDSTHYCDTEVYSVDTEVQTTWGMIHCSDAPNTASGLTKAHNQPS